MIQGTLSNQILDWLDVVQVELQSSAWGSVLRFYGLDIIDCLRASLVQNLLSLVRQESHYQTTSHVTGKPRVSSLGFVSKRHMHAIAHQLRATLRSASPRSAEIVFWPCEPTHIRAQIPVFRQMQSQQIQCQFVVNKARIFEQLHAYGLPVIYASNSFLSRLPAAYHTDDLAGGKLASHPDVRLPPLPGNPDIDPIPTIYGILKELLPVVYQSIAITRSVSSKCMPSVLVVGNDLTLEGRTACLWARSNQLPTVSLMHGSISGSIFHREHVADRFLVYGPDNFRELTELGLDARQIVVCGAPYLDHLPRQRGQVHPQIQARLGLVQGQHIVLLATSGPGNSISAHHHKQIIRDVMELSIRVPEVRFVAKLHRKDRQEYYDEVRQHVPGERLIVIPDGSPGLPNDIFDWLQGCQIVLTGASTVAIEAMIMDVPVISMDFASELQAVNFIDAGATLHVTSREQLLQAVQTLLKKEAALVNIRKSVSVFLSEQFMALDGRSAERCVQAILQVTPLIPQIQAQTSND